MERDTPIEFDPVILLLHDPDRFLSVRTVIGAANALIDEFPSDDGEEFLAAIIRAAPPSPCCTEPAERTAAQAIRPELQTMIDDIKAKIADRATTERTKRDAVSNILGGGN